MRGWFPAARAVTWAAWTSCFPEGIQGHLVLNCPRVAFPASACSRDQQQRPFVSSSALPTRPKALADLPDEETVAEGAKVTWPRSWSC